MSGALEGLRVLDMSRILAGPWLGQLLADLGAEVWKIERPGSGDDTRQWGPPYLKDSDDEDTSEAAYFLSANRGKKSICIDIRSNEGQELIKKLAAKADILIENYKTGDLDRYGLGYEDLKLINPGLIYCSITGYGHTGPYRNRAGYDMAIQAIGGLMGITGEVADQPGGGPQKVGIPIADILTGLYSCVAVLAACHHRKGTGMGQHVDMALLDVMVGSLANQNLNYLTTGIAPKLMGNAHPNIVPYQVFKTSNGSFILAVGNDGQFQKFCQVADLENLAHDPRFDTNSNRLANRAELVSKISALTISKTTETWVEMLTSVGVPCAPIQSLDQVFADPQVIDRGMKVAMSHPLAGEIELVANPIKFSSSAIEYKDAPPTLNQHRDYILQDVLQLSDEDYARLATGAPVAPDGGNR